MAVWEPTLDYRLREPTLVDAIFSSPNDKTYFILLFVDEFLECSAYSAAWLCAFEKQLRLEPPERIDETTTQPDKLI